MLNISFSELSKSLFVVLLVMVCIIGFTKNTSYAMSFDEFFYYVQDHYNAEYDNLSYDLKSYLGKWLTYVNKNTMRNLWQDNNAVVMDFGLTPNSNSKTVYMYFINNNNNLTFGRTISGVGSYKRLGFDVYNSKNQVNIGSVYSYNANISLSSNTYFVSSTKTNRNAFIVQEKQKQSATNEYWFTDILTRYNFVFLDNYINYNNQYKTIGYLDGQDLNTHKFEAILYSDYGTSSEVVVGRVNPYQNVTYNMNIPMYDNNHIYISVLSRLLLPNEDYYLRVLYDNEYDFEDNIYFTFQTDASGNIINGDYNVQNSTNDIIQNQNQNNQNLINTIKSGEEYYRDSGDWNSISGFFGFSGDVTSGDTDNIASQLGYSERANPWQDFINRMLYDIGDVLMNNENVTYTLGFHNNYSLVLHSEDFVLPNGPIKTFLNACLTYFIVVILYQEMKKIINKINEGDYIYALDRGDAVEYFYM